MARRASLEAQLARIAELRKGSLGEAECAELEGLLAKGGSHALAAAARVVAEHGAAELRPALVAAFQGLMRPDPVKRDPACLGKAAIAEALHELDADEPGVYLAGVAHQQMEPVWGGREDTALALRTACGRGLVRMRHPDALLHLAELLADPAPLVRIEAARSLAYYGAPDALPLLRLKVRSGDEELEVVAECLLALMRISPESSLDFVAGFLEAEDAQLAESAALALGESRAPGAFEVLRAWRLPAARRGLGDVALTALAMLRTDAALGHLLELIAIEPGPVARQAIAAFEIHRHDDALRARVEAAAGRDNVDLADALEETFGS